jgi:1-acyl-sn-glycerol-3-phosphate acyltransferase
MRPSSFAFVGLVRLLVGAYARWVGCQPENVQRLYFANHSSHIDTLALWSALPVRLRARTRPVAANDYWGSGPRRYLATRVLRAVLIDRTRADRTIDPLAPLAAALGRGDSLILFPEGTRGRERLPGPFKSGLYRLSQEFPAVQLIPVYLENLHRCMPKGAILPIPITCTVRFGTPLSLRQGESKEDFLARARDAVIGLAGGAHLR